MAQQHIHLTDEQKQSLRPFLLDFVQEIIGGRKGRNDHGKSNFFVCPLCNSGNGKNGTSGFNLEKNTARPTTWHCFACGRGGDIFTLYREYYGTDMAATMDNLWEKYGSAAAAPAPIRAAVQPPKPTKEETETLVRDHSRDFDRWAKALSGSVGETYLLRRGLTVETMQRARIGFIPESYNGAKEWNEARITIPYSTVNSEYYCARIIAPKNGVRHLKPNKDQYGKTPLFHPENLYKGGVVYVVESPLCCLSIEQAGGNAVALSGAENGNLLLQAIDKDPDTIHAAVTAFAVCLDYETEPDKVEKIATAVRELDKGLRVRGYKTCDVCGAIMGDNGEAGHDPNDVLQRMGAEWFSNAIKETNALVIEAVKQPDEDDGMDAESGGVVVEIDPSAIAEESAGIESAVSDFDRFLTAVQSRLYEPVPTYIPELDSLLGGGVNRQQLIVINAAPGAGKTALAQWITESMAAHGHPVIFCNLEMPLSHLYARMTARLVHRLNPYTTLNVASVLRGYDWTYAQRAEVYAAKEQYEKTIAAHMRYKSRDEVGNTWESIKDHLEQFAADEEKRGNHAPVVVIDYLQIIGSANPQKQGAELYKDIIDGLKDYATRHNAVVFCISAMNRNSIKTGEASITSGRDTSAIEYTADIQATLTYTVCLPKDNTRPARRNLSTDDVTPELTNDRTLVITKNRMTQSGGSLRFFFDGAAMDFTPIDAYTLAASEAIKNKGGTPYKGSTPFDSDGNGR